MTRRPRRRIVVLWQAMAIVFVIAVLGLLALTAMSVLSAEAQPAQGEPLDGRRNQKIEHIRVEDKGARVDELRYGGVTQNITVQPKNDMPSYEVMPSDPSRQGSAATGGGDKGPRVWNVLKF